MYFFHIRYCVYKPMEYEINKTLRYCRKVLDTTQYHFPNSASTVKRLSGIFFPRALVSRLYLHLKLWHLFNKIGAVAFQVNFIKFLFNITTKRSIFLLFVTGITYKRYYILYIRSAESSGALSWPTSRS